MAAAMLASSCRRAAIGGQAHRRYTAALPVRSRLAQRRTTAAAGAAPGPAVPSPSPEFFKEMSGTGKAPWEIGRAQAVVAQLADAGEFDNCSVLDVGCCIGDNTIYVAKHAKGATVTACDLVERALNVARSKAAAAGVEVEFVQQDLTQPPQGALKGRQFDVVMDSAVYHCFSGAELEKYVATIKQLVKPGGRYVMLVFSDKQGGEGGPVRVTQASIRGSFPPPEFSVERLEDSITESVPEIFEGQAKAYLAVIRKAAPAT